MSTFDSDDMPGYFLPEDSQFRLKKLRDQMTFLSRLAQPRSWNEQDYALEVPMGELAICLESLAEQVTLVLEEVSWPAQRQKAASEGDVAPTQSPKVPDAAAERFAFGVTLDQFDTLDRLIQTISAHGDALACSHAAKVAGDTLPRIGQAIYDGLEAVRAVLDEVETQQLGPRPGPRSGVGETQAVYRVKSASSDGDDVRAMTLPVSTCAYAAQSRRMRLH
jgi:hypothetical protein